MKKIDELFDNYELNYDINIQPSEMDELELKRIKEMTLNKLDIKPKKVKRFNKKTMIPLVAAAILTLTSITAIAGSDLNSLFGRIFESGVENIEESGKLINVSDSHDGITFKVNGVVGDSNTATILFDITKDNSEPFSGEMVTFDKLDITLNGSGGWSYNQYNSEEISDTASFSLTMDKRKGLYNKQLSISITNINSVDYLEKASSVDIYSLLLNNKELQNISIPTESIELPKREDLPLMSDDEFYKFSLSKKHEKELVIEAANMNMDLFEGVKGAYLDNIGIINGKLQLCLKRSNLSDFTRVYFVDKNTNEEIHDVFSFTQTMSTNDYSYDKYYFDISAVEELENLELRANFYDSKEIHEGKWNVQFNLDYNNVAKKHRVNKEIKFKDEKFEVKTIEISPVSITVKMKRDSLYPQESFDGYNDIKVKLKDGTFASYHSGGTSGGGLEISSTNVFKNPINPEDVVSVIVGNYEILIK